MINTWVLKLQTCSSKTTTTSSSSHNNIPLQLILPRNIFKNPRAQEDHNPIKTHMMKKKATSSLAFFYNFHITWNKILVYLCLWSLTNNKQNKSKHTNKQTNKQIKKLAKTKHTNFSQTIPLWCHHPIKLHSNWSGDRKLCSSCKASYSSRKSKRKNSKESILPVKKRYCNIKRCIHTWCFFKDSSIIKLP